MASCFPPLLPLHRFPQEAPEHIGKHPRLSPHTICSPLPAVCLCLLFKPGSWWWQGFGGVGFDGLLQWGVSRDHGESLCAGAGHFSVQLQQLLECRLQTSDAERELSLKGFQRRSVQPRNDAPVAPGPRWDWWTPWCWEFVSTALPCFAFPPTCCLQPPLLQKVTLLSVLGPGLNSILNHQLWGASCHPKFHT